MTGLLIGHENISWLKNQQRQWNCKWFPQCTSFRRTFSRCCDAIFCFLILLLPAHTCIFPVHPLARQEGRLCPQAPWELSDAQPKEMTQDHILHDALDINKIHLGTPAPVSNCQILRETKLVMNRSQLQSK